MRAEGFTADGGFVRSASASVELVKGQFASAFLSLGDVAPKPPSDAGVPDAVTNVGQDAAEDGGDGALVEVDVGVDGGLDAGLDAEVDTGADSGVEPDDSGVPANLDAEPPDSGLYCGDGRATGVETCDDGNTLAGDGCSACTVEAGWVCTRRSPSRCFRESEVAIVDGNAPGCPGSGSGTDADPYCTVGDGVDSLRPAVLVRTSTYSESVRVSNTTVYIAGEEGATIDGNDGLALVIEMGATATVTGLHLLADESDAGVLKIHQMGTRAWVSECEIGPSLGVGIDVKVMTTVSLERNIVRGNDLGGIKLDTPAHRAVNNIIALNGGDNATFGGVYIKRRPARFPFANNTVARNRSSGMPGQVPGIRCDDSGSPIVNTIVWANTSAMSGSPQVSSDCVFRYSDVGPQSGLSGTNISQDPQLDTRFHLSSGSPCIDRGDPAGTELAGGPAPILDVDGDSRRGRVVDIGADEDPGGM